MNRAHLGKPADKGLLSGSQTRREAVEDVAVFTPEHGAATDAATALAVDGFHDSGPGPLLLSDDFGTRRGTRDGSCRAPSQ
jgi:hypothetical protein